MVSDAEGALSGSSITPDVLILVLMEYGLWQSYLSNNDIAAQCVLILVLMEYGLWPEVQLLDFTDVGES